MKMFYFTIGSQTERQQREESIDLERHLENSEQVVVSF